ncbi:hypothetical protein PQQ77_15140 [Paraburkholderia strydomiana]|uniref:hypothetical protein n=1 Tax=Paraburkholderia strydomiana TaxID=1245417 RepID=UPI0038B804FB
MSKLSEADKGGTTPAGRNVPLLFPNGIELIRLTFKVGEQISIELAIAGEKAPKLSFLPGSDIKEAIVVGDAT